MFPFRWLKTYNNVKEFYDQVFTNSMYISYRQLKQLITDVRITSLMKVAENPWICKATVLVN